jgi:peptidoglycan/xylan/chitin deacetylase (PgdA/CDA1 family)
MLKIALTHDVDRICKHYQYFTHTIKCLGKKDLNGSLYHLGSVFREEPYWSFPTIIKIEKEFGVKSTFFFMDETIKFALFDKSNWKLSLGRYRLTNPKIIEMIKYLDDNGWEIGLHGSYNSFSDEILLLKEKKIIEDVLEHKVIGIRQHYLNLNEKTWDIQQNCGFKYDSSFGYNNKVGYRENKYIPFHPFGNDFTVIPLVVMDDCYFAARDNWEEFLKLLDITEEKGGILVINWHQRNFNEREFPNHSHIYCNMIEEGMRRSAVFKTLSEYYIEMIN